MNNKQQILAALQKSKQNIKRRKHSFAEVSDLEAIEERIEELEKALRKISSINFGLGLTKKVKRKQIQDIIDDLL